MTPRGHFRVIPAVDLKGGRCVTLVGGDPARTIVELDDPIKAARSWEEQGASMLHLIDLDGAIGGRPANLDTAKEILQDLRIPVEFGGGIRSVESARALLDLGMNRVILGTLALSDPASVSLLSKEFGPDRVMVALDFREGKVLIRGWRSSSDIDPVTAAGEFEGRGAGSVLFTNVEVEGRLQGIPVDPIRKIVGATKMEVIASGGVTTMKDLIAIKEAGAAGAVVGAAIYTGRINLREAIEAVEE